MATVNFSVPEHVKQEFNQLFATENKSAILTQLMLQAIEARKQQQRRAVAIDKIVQLRNTQAPVSLETIEQVKENLRS
jgi:hypothetical protein